MDSRVPTVVEMTALKNSLLLTVVELVFEMGGLPFKFEPVADSLAPKFKKPVSIIVKTTNDSFILAMELDQLTEFCSYIPSAQDSIQSSVEGGAIIVEYVGIDLWDSLENLLGTPVAPALLLAGNTTQPANTIHARVTSSQGHDFPVAVSCICKQSVSKLFDLLIEKDPALTKLTKRTSPTDVNTIRIFAGMMDAPRDHIAGLQRGDVIDITNQEQLGIEGIMLLSDTTALPVRLYPTYVEFIADAEETQLTCSKNGYPYLSQLGSQPAKNQARLGYMFARSSLTMKEIRRAKMAGGMNVNLLDETQLIYNGDILATGRVATNDGVVQFTVGEVN